MSCEIISHTNHGDHMVNLTNVKLYEDKKYGYCLDLTYRVETPAEILEFNIPKLYLGVDRRKFVIKREIDDIYEGHGMLCADVGFGEKRLLGKNAYTMKLIKTKTKEMTLAEIEKRLGHKVKIVNE